MKQILRSLVAIAIAATAACGSTPAGTPGGASSTGGSGATPINLPGGSFKDPVPGLPGVSVQVTIGGVSQPVTQKVFCGDSFRNAPVGTEGTDPPSFVIAWGDAPPGYQGPGDRNGGVIPQSMSGAQLLKTDLTNLQELIVLTPKTDYIYIPLLNKNVDDHGNVGHVSKSGQTFHMTGTIDGNNKEGVVTAPATPFDVTVTCPY